jgi:hypothetical protein
MGGLVLAACVVASQTTSFMRASTLRRAPPETTSAIVAGWLDEPRAAAKKMIAKYGQPHEATAVRMVWWNNGPWKYTELVKEEIPHNFPMPHHDMLRQAINYRVSTDAYDELAKYDGSVIVERTKGEISARCDKEEANFLAIHLANDVAMRKRTVANARTFYANAIKAMMAGRTNATQKRYLSGFVFNVPKADRGDRDMRHQGM